MIIIWAERLPMTLALKTSNTTRKKKTGNLERHSGNASVITLLFKFHSSLARFTTMQVYDLAWSPTSEYIITGSTDNMASLRCCRWKMCLWNSRTPWLALCPRCNEYIATQSSDRSVHVYRISERRSVFRRKKWVSKKEYRLYYCRVQYITTFKITTRRR